MHPTIIEPTTATPPSVGDNLASMRQSSVAVVMSAFIGMVLVTVSALTYNQIRYGQWTLPPEQKTPEVVRQR